MTQKEAARTYLILCELVESKPIKSIPIYESMVRLGECLKSDFDIKLMSFLIAIIEEDILEHIKHQKQLFTVSQN